MDPLSPAALAALCEQNRGVTAIGIASVLVGIAIVTVSLRLYIRKYVLNSMGWDDYTIAASLLFGIIAFGLYVQLYHSGMGRHIQCLDIQNISDSLKYSFLSQIFITVNLGLSKVSVCLMVLRVIKKSQDRFTLFLWALIAFVIISHVVQVILFLVQCRPTRYVWAILQAGHCFSARYTYIISYVTTGCDCFADLACAAIPIYVIQKLHMNKHTKIALCILMGLGIFTAACALAQAVTVRGVFDADYTWAITEPSLWAAIGGFTGTIIASLPVLRTLFPLKYSIKISISRKPRFHKVNASSSSSSGSRPIVQMPHPIAKHVPLNLADDYAPYNIYDRKDPVLERDLELANTTSSF